MCAERGRDERKYARQLVNLCVYVCQHMRNKWSVCAHDHGAGGVLTEASRKRARDTALNQARKMKTCLDEVLAHLPSQGLAHLLVLLLFTDRPSLLPAPARTTPLGLGA